MREDAGIVERVDQIVERRTGDLRRLRRRLVSGGGVAAVVGVFVPGDEGAVLLALAVVLFISALVSLAAAHKYRSVKVAQQESSWIAGSLRGHTTGSGWAQRTKVSYRIGDDTEERVGNVTAALGFATDVHFDPDAFFLRMPSGQLAVVVSTRPKLWWLTPIGQPNER